MIDVNRDRGVVIITKMKTKTDSQVSLCPQTDAERRWLALCSYLSHAANKFIACHWATHTNPCGHSLQWITVGMSLRATAWTLTMLVIVINMVNTNQLNYGRKSVWRKQSHTCKWTVMIQQQPIFVWLQQYAKIGRGSSSLTGKTPWLKLSSHTKMTN